MLSYGAKLVRDGSITGPDLLAFIIYQLTLGGILHVSVRHLGRIISFLFLLHFRRSHKSILR